VRSGADIPLVCICIPTFNAEKTIRETLDSIVKQRYKNLDIHVVDNASTDATLKIVGEFDDPRIKIHRNEVNVGGEGNFNRCIQLATGKYTAIFHADDIYELDMVEAQVAFLEANPAAGAVFTEAKLIDEDGSFIGKIPFPREFSSAVRLYDFKKILKAVLRHSNFLICPSVMARTDVYQHEIRSWRGEMFSSSADLDVWLRIAQLHPVGILPMPLMRYRISNSQWSAGVRLQTEQADFFRVIDHYLGQSDIRAILVKRDIQNYAELERRDSVMRAINFFLMGKTGAVRALLGDINSWDALGSAFQSKRGIGVLVAAIYLHILLLLRLNKFGQITLIFMKQAMGK
jgi:glycosyltransferase involved in cell wall biosynthesis